MDLGPRARAAGFGHIHLPIVDSTNAEAFRRRGDRLWITGGAQTSGRGRRGRDWTSPPGNLYASLRLEDPAPSRRAAELCFVAALALSDAVAATAPRAGAQLALKWPNDVLIGGAKVAGILVEAVHEADRFAAAIGCGVNIAHHPEGLAYPVTHLAATDKPVDAALLFSALSDAIALRLDQWRAGDGFIETRSDWLSRAAGLGRPVKVRLPDREIEGVFEALDEEGALILREAGGGRRPISAGEIFFAAPSEAWP
jgi:BirA family transcriptional regulator, biotin operon repressor / biotin---[acetyl-CoA-carboxylase] ligase